MRLSERLDYPASPDQVFAMITDRAFREEVCAATAALSWSVEVDPGDVGASVTVRRVMPAEVPDMVKRLVGETLEVVQIEQWEGADGDHRRAELLVEISDQPAKLLGTLTIEGAGESTTVTLDGDIKVSIPMLGGRLEKEMAKAVRSALEVEHRLGVDYLT